LLDSLLQENFRVRIKKMPRPKLNGLEIILQGDDDLLKSTQEEEWGDYVPALKHEDQGDAPGFQMLDGKEAETGEADQWGNVEIFLVNDEGKSFNNVIKVIQEKNSENVFSCDQCGFSTSKESYLISHKKQKIHGAGNYVCDICGTLFNSLGDLETHQEKLHQEARYQCTECDYEARDSKSARKHFRYNHGEESIKCDFCDFSFRSEKSLIKHKILKHSDKLTKFKCTMCDFSSVWSDNLKRHIESKHESSQYMCNICFYIGPNQRSFKHHMKRHEGKVFNCDNCDYSSPTHAQLYAHTRDCSKSDQLEKCDECDFECTSMQKLRRHRDAKHGNLWFFCDMCDYVGKTKDQIRNHKANSHTIFVCHVCQKEEKSQYLIHKHIATEHIGEWDVPSACDQCDFVGKNKRSLQYHKKKHEGKIYSCAKCNYTAPTMEQLRNHKNSKHGVLKLSCDFCDFKCSVNWRLKQHVLRRHSFPKPEKVGRKRKVKSALMPKKSDNEVQIDIKLEDEGKAELKHALDHIVNTDEPVLYEVSI